MKEYIVNYTNIEEGIPKIIHQMWIGPHKMPTRYINTWRYDYIKENPDWKYMFWTEKEIEDLNNTILSYQTTQDKLHGAISDMKGKLEESLVMNARLLYSNRILSFTFDHTKIFLYQANQIP